MRTDTPFLMHRRQFHWTLAAAASALATPAGVVAAEPAKKKYKYCAFVKFLESLDYDELADGLARAGFDGAEVTCRQKSTYIAPARVADELPRLKEALDARGLEISILTTDILRADEPHAERVLRAAAAAGVPRYRLGFYRYDLEKPILPQLSELVPVVEELAALNRDVGIAGIYQNHAGANFVGATIWDLHRLIKDFPTSELGCVFDIRHASAEGGEAWPVYFRLMQPHLGAVSVKDYRWNGRKSQHTPLGDGRVDPKFFALLQQSDFDGPISVHVEYLPHADAKEVLAALERDLATLKSWMDEA